VSKVVVPWVLIAMINCIYRAFTYEYLYLWVLLLMAMGACIYRVVSMVAFNFVCLVSWLFVPIGACIDGCLHT
jgi:hypothetical protein